MDRPSNSTPCSACHHKFSLHYTSFGGDKTGCGEVFYDQRGESETGRCKCIGFTIVYKYDSGSPSKDYYDR